MVDPFCVFTTLVSPLPAVMLSVGLVRALMVVVPFGINGEWSGVAGLFNVGVSGLAPTDVVLVIDCSGGGLAVTDFATVAVAASVLICDCCCCACSLVCLT